MAFSIFDKKKSEPFSLDFLWLSLMEIYFDLLCKHKSRAFVYVMWIRRGIDRLCKSPFSMHVVIIYYHFLCFTNPCYRCEQAKTAWMTVFAPRYPTKPGVSEAGWASRVKRLGDWGEKGRPPATRGIKNKKSELFSSDFSMFGDPDGITLRMRLMRKNLGLLCKNRPRAFCYVVSIRWGIDMLCVVASLDARWSPRFWRPFRSSFIAAFFDSLVCACS
jgi:hypothetical protein